MAPKARPIDLGHVQALLDQGHTQRQIAAHLQLPESTLRHRLKRAGLLGTPPVQQRQDLPEDSSGGPETDQGRPWEGMPLSDLGPPEGDLGIPVAGIPHGDLGIPLESTPRDSSGIPSNIKGIPEVDHGSPLEGIPKGDLGIPVADHPEVYIGGPVSGLPGDIAVAQQLARSSQLGEELRAVWPELQALLAWWRVRSQVEHVPQEKLTRVTYHVAPQWIDAVKREADRSGESYAAVVNRAFALYFGQRST